MDATIQQALQNDHLIDITTLGAKTGTPHRIEITFHNFDGVLFISGRPGKRDWYANLVAHPQFTFHLKQSTQADLNAVATPITDAAARRPILSKIVEKWGRQAELEAYLNHSPLVAVQLQTK